MRICLEYNNKIIITDNDVSFFSAGEFKFNIPQGNYYSDGCFELIVNTESKHINSDIILICLIANAIDELDIRVPKNLTLNYLPYSRQDRVCNAGESFSLKVIIGILKKL